ncbi:DUF721 domain-containing protein [Streptomyces sp. NPDC052095]|uniref:DUF721 domain-containing protein n=1 Tax=unclassified Streptomyces TaxID=2593676 RepID=UPI00344DC31C
MAFDLLHNGNEDLTGWPYERRRAALEELFAEHRLMAPLTLCPSTTDAAWATQTRLKQTNIIKAANASAGRTVVRTLRILAPDTVPASEPAAVGPKPTAAPARPPRTRETASDGYHRALATHLQTARPSRTDPGIEAAVQRQTAALREQSLQAFPEPPAPGSAPAPIDQARAERRRQSDASHTAALRRARAERAAGEAGNAVAVPQTTLLGRTA